MKELWDRLGRVKESRLWIEEETTTREGSGTVTIDRPDPSTIVWEESGTWEDAPQHRINYRDRLHWGWTAERGLLTLHHARRGDDAAVHLGDLAPGADGVWRSLAPHLCGADSYDAALTFDADELAVVWRVTGPRKSYLTVRRYR